MARGIRRAAVLGAGVMGSAIAAHLANAGIPTFLLDVVPPELTDEDRQKGFTRDTPAFRNRIAARGLEVALRASPPAFFSPADARLITIGNVEDHLAWLTDADWIVEAVIERLEVKTGLLARVEAHRKAGNLVSSNTSGIPIRRLAAGRSDDFRRHFLGTHFFNPPRYMKLLELIPGPDTLSDSMRAMAEFGERVLGKGVVLAKDTPNFIANRIGTFGLFAAMRLMTEGGYTIEEVDCLTGPAIGRPKSATFRTADLVGLDTVMQIATNIAEGVSDEAERQAYAVPAFLVELVRRGWLGEKSGQGFYKRVKSAEGSEILVLDYTSMEYRPQRAVSFPSLDAAQGVEEAAARIRALASADDRGGRFVWQALREMLHYAAQRIPEIADEITGVDRAMTWGFGWELGPFEIWDALGVEPAGTRMEREGRELPPLVKQVLASDARSFYRQDARRRYVFEPATGNAVTIEQPPHLIILPVPRERERIVAGNAGASLIDLGDGVACLEFHSKNNAIGPDIVEMLRRSVGLCRDRFDALIIGNQARHFSVGANLLALLFEAQDENWGEIARIVVAFQDTVMALKQFEKPVVAAPFAMTLGAGCEICLHAARVRAAAETYIGLPEVGVGLIPAGGGCKELLLRALEGIPVGVEVDLLPLFRHAFETIAYGKVSTSAKDAQQLGYLRWTDRFTMNQDCLLYDAKQTALAMLAEGYTPTRPRDDIPVLGERGLAVAETQVYNLRSGDYITEHDALILRKVAAVLAGGRVPPGTRVNERYLLDLEREAFLSLCGERKSQARMQHMLKTGKPLRN